MLGLALSHVESRAAAEEVMQDAWLTVLRSLDWFERPPLFAPTVRLVASHGPVGSSPTAGRK